MIVSYLYMFLTLTFLLLSQLLGELLLDRSNFKVMMAYINDKNNLRLIMNMLRNTSTAIQFEAFHIFKVFVANPKKTLDIATVLYQNQAKIISFLSDFCTDRGMYLIITCVLSVTLYPSF
jgi:hypothetical protein